MEIRFCLLYSQVNGSERKLSVVNQPPTDRDYAKFLGYIVTLCQPGEVPLLNQLDIVSLTPLLHPDRYIWPETVDKDDLVVVTSNYSRLVRGCVQCELSGDNICIFKEDADALGITKYETYSHYWARIGDR